MADQAAWARRRTRATTSRSRCSARWRPTAVFTLAGTLWAAARPSVRGGAGGGRRRRPWSVCLVLGNLAGVRAWIDARDPPGDYDWFAPSRVIPDTINEFPSFSLLLQDLHAHVLALPFTLVALAFALQVVLAGPRGDALLAQRRRGARRGAGDRVPVRRQLVVVPGRRRPARARRRGVGAQRRARGRRGYAARVAGARAGSPASSWCCRSGSSFDPAARGIGLVEERAPVRRVHGRQGADLRRSSPGR